MLPLLYLFKHYIYINTDSNILILYFGYNPIVYYSILIRMQNDVFCCSNCSSFAPLDDSQFSFCVSFWKALIFFVCGKIHKT